MKETKVYVDELPEICDECPCHSVMEDRCVLLRKQIIEPFLQSCPLKSLKTHDRELVNEVCEKIREYLRTQVIYCGGKATELDIMIASAGNQVLEDIKQFLDQIQKEFEK